MKRGVLFIFLVSISSIAFAQKADSAVTKTAKTRNVDGAMMSSANDLVTNLSASPQFSTLAKLINAADLADSLKTRTITFFAPTNRAFDKLAPGTIDTLLLPAHKADLVALVNYLALPTKITAQEINRQVRAGNGQAALTTLSGGILTARINENRNIALTDERGGQSVVTKFNIEQSNGMLFVIDNVPLPVKKQ